MKCLVVLLLACVAVCCAQKFIPNNNVLTCFQHMECGKNEVYRCCGMCFEQTCTDQSRDKECQHRCYKGCYCQNDYTRKREGGFCVPDKECRSVVSG
ncbi:cysteine-rich venom protein 6-like [Anopheles stephensi]|uniref:cysteine-rich venom protein 6-like n=1 Tax=Anopheles stephensi TaxID=30069 RepID=UPI0009B4F58A|nr:cysteine-rich venom protein 6-like [Anopheles stephensi]